MKADRRTNRCTDEYCSAPLPYIYGECRKIETEEIPHFAELVGAMRNGVKSYFVQMMNTAQDFHQLIYIWVDPQIHHDPENLVQGAGNILHKTLTLDEELEYFQYHDRSDFLNKCRMANCPNCSKKLRGFYIRALSKEQYADLIRHK